MSDLSKWTDDQLAVKYGLLARRIREARAKEHELREQIQKVVDEQIDRGEIIT